MRKTPPKLALRKETLRALSNIDLVRVVGCKPVDAPLLGDLTHEPVCPTTAVAPKA